MTNKVGFIQCVTARNKKYYYLRKAYRDSQQIVKKENIYNFGRKDEALFLIKSWIESDVKIPDHMKKYDIDDFKKWIQYIEDKEKI